VCRILLNKNNILKLQAKIAILEIRIAAPDYGTVVAY